jgi:hypothetical protein
LALVRGDIVQAMSKDEGQTILNQLFNAYLTDAAYQKVNEFNHQPNKFNIDQYTNESL